MASVSNISLSLSSGSAANTRNVTTTRTMTFGAGEVGKSYRLEGISINPALICGHGEA